MSSDQHVKYRMPGGFPVTRSLLLYYHVTHTRTHNIASQNKERILPVAALSIALYVLCRSMSASNFAPEVAILSSAL